MITNRDIRIIITVLTVASAWLLFVERPTTRNLARALLTTG